MQRGARIAKIAALVDVLDEEHIPEACYSAALQMAIDILEQESGPIMNRLDAQRAAETAKTLFMIARLASGASTSNVAHASLNSDDHAARLTQLRQSLAALEAVEPVKEPDASQQ